nr:phage scaffolding protein [Aneurinibacillus sp. XH2]
MDWLKELLKKLGVSESDIDKIDSEVTKELPKHFVPKTQYNDVVEARKKAEKDVVDRDKQLEDLKKSTGDAEALKQQIEKLQSENKEAKEKYEAEARDLQMKTALKLNLAGKVHDPDLVAGLIEKSKIELDDSGNIKAGLDDQIKALQESKAFLFVPEKSDAPAFKGFKPFDGASPSEGSGSNIGKMLAQQSKQAGNDTAKAQANYFGGMSNE